MATRAIKTLTTIQDTIEYVKLSLKEIENPEQRENITNAIKEISSWNEKDVENKKCTTLNTDYTVLRDSTAFKRRDVLNSVSVEYFVPQLKAILGSEISQERKTEIEALIEEISELDTD